MVSTFTQNKSLEQPAHGDFVNSWETPVNTDWSQIDTAFGGSSLLNSTGLSGDTALTATQYRPLSLLISGTPTGTITYVVPSGVGGQWVFLNGTAGGQTVGIKSGAGGSTITVAAGLSVIVSCDGSASGMRKSITEPAIAAGATGQIQYNATGVLGATGGLTWTTVSATSPTGALGVTGSISASGPISASGLITSTTGGFIFPDATVQRTAAPITGLVFDYIGTTVPTGYVFANGTTIGSAASAATGRANVDTLPLYTLLWNSWANGQAAVSGGRGANAAADFAANKTIALPDLRGMIVAGMDTNGGVASADRLNSMASATAGATGGLQSNGIFITVTGTSTTNVGNSNSGVNNGGDFQAATNNHTHAFGVTSNGVNNISTVQPTMVMSKIIAL